MHFNCTLDTRLEISKDCWTHGTLLEVVDAMTLSSCVCMQTCVGQDPPGEWADAPGGTGKRYLHREETLTALLKEAGYSEISMERDRSRGALERQEDISSFGNQKIILIFAATK